MGNIKSIQDFLILPDWKKVQLKINEKRYLTYPYMTNEEEQRRKEKIYMIASHFSKVDFNDLIENPIYTLDDTWPLLLEKFITPKLLDLVPIEFWCQFGQCYFCAHRRGDKKTHFKLILKKKSLKAFPLSNYCRIKKSRSDKRRNLIVRYNHCCSVWLPDRLYQGIYSINIENFLKFNNFYSLKDYISDLRNINIWDYFFDKYSTEDGEVY
jgi:hypothetical protein